MLTLSGFFTWFALSILSSHTFSECEQMDAEAGQSEAKEAQFLPSDCPSSCL